MFDLRYTDRTHVVMFNSRLCEWLVRGVLWAGG